MLVAVQLLMPQLHRLNSLICLLEEGFFDGVRRRRRIEERILNDDLRPMFLIILFLFETELRLVTFIA